MEDTVNKAKEEVEERMFKRRRGCGGFRTWNYERASRAFKTLGRLLYRTSYGQNVLKHSLEALGHLSGMLATELGANVTIAKRAGLLHDIGKAVDQTQDGTHIELGVELARRYGETEAGIHAIGAHHDDIAAETIEAVIVKIADAMSAGKTCEQEEILFLKFTLKRNPKASKK
ncbi:MAG: HDIG domain-containing protein [Desulfobacterales bacterium]|nr:HDIG domain-containing protein [Desulfobacterales bacterium]